MPRLFRFTMEMKWTSGTYGGLAERHFARRRRKKAIKIALKPPYNFDSVEADFGLNARRDSDNKWDVVWILEINTNDQVAAQTAADDLALNFHGQGKVQGPTPADPPVVKLIYMDPA